MRKLFEIFRLEVRSLVRSKAFSLLLLFGVGWMLAFPHLVEGDGTFEGTRELVVHFSLGGVFAMVVVALLASATGSIARERTARRLPLTLVRPVRYSSIVFGKIAAHVVVGALVLAAACAVLACREDIGRPCFHVHSPVMPSPREEAKAMYEEYMKDPATPENVRRAKKSAVLRILEARAKDHYQVVATNSTGRWRFDGLGGLQDADRLSVRMRFAAQYDTRQEVRGTFAIGTWRATVSNVTQTVLTMPLERRCSDREQDCLTFDNEGREALMLRPRRDIEILTSADGFGWNLLRTFFGLVAILALVVSVGLFLSAGLGRPVAIFVAFVILIVSEMSPSVLDQYPEELEAKLADRIGLVITRTVATAVRPLSAASPIESLSRDDCVEAPFVAELALADLLAVPLLVSLFGAMILPRKQDDD